LEAEFFRTLYDYSCWARDRILAAADGMSEEEYAKPNGFSNYGSLRGILTHQLASEQGYLARWKGETVDRVSEESAPNLESITRVWQEQESKMRAYLSGLSDADVEREIVSPIRTGGEFRRPFAMDIMQILNHGTQHRSEAAEALTIVGRSPGDLDLSLYLRTRANA
jgi:uncharacterized damage-inducible protein DinB